MCVFDTTVTVKTTNTNVFDQDVTANLLLLKML